MYKILEIPPPEDSQCDFYTSVDYSKKSPMVGRCKNAASITLGYSFPDEIYICQECLEKLDKNKIKQ